MRVNSGAMYCFPACDHDASRCSMYPAAVGCQMMHSATEVLVRVCSE
jgi:hypothetical protein